MATENYLLYCIKKSEDSLLDLNIKHSVEMICCGETLVIIGAATCCRRALLIKEPSSLLEKYDFWDYLIDICMLV